MGFKLVICPPNYQDHWPQRLQEEIPGIDVHLCPTVGEAMEVIGDADAAFGDIVPELLERANNLKWVACPPGRAARRLLPSFADCQRRGSHQHPGDLQRPHQRAHHVPAPWPLPAGCRCTSPSRSPASGAGIPDHLPARGHRRSCRCRRHRRRDRPPVLGVRHDRAGSGPSTAGSHRRRCRAAPTRRPPGKSCHGPTSWSLLYRKRRKPRACSAPSSFRP